MGPKDVIKNTLDTSNFILHKYLDDLTDADIRLRPVEGMHPIALQLGHLIVAEQMFNEMVKPGSAPAFPTGSRRHNHLKNKELSDSGFSGKEKYVELLATQQAATKAVLDAIPDSDLEDTRGGKLPPFAPTIGALLEHDGDPFAQSFRPVRGGSAQA